MQVVNPQTIDLEITQYLIQSGHDRDTAVGNVLTFMFGLYQRGAIETPTVVPVVNNTSQFSVSYKLQNGSSVFQKVYTAAKPSNNTMARPKPPQGTQSKPQPRGYTPPTAPAEPDAPKPEKKRDYDDDWDRAMRGI